MAKKVQVAGTQVQNRTKPSPKPLLFDEKRFVMIFMNEVLKETERIVLPAGKQQPAPKNICDSVDQALLNIVCKILRLQPKDLGFGENWLFALLRFEEFRNLNSNPLFKECVAEAVKLNQCGFFVRLGVALSEKPDSIQEAVKSYKIELHLITSWISTGSNTTGFCNLSDEQIVILLKNALSGGQGIKHESLRKKWVRLGLQKGKLLKKGRIVIGPPSKLTLKAESGKWAKPSR